MPAIATRQATIPNTMFTIVSVEIDMLSRSGSGIYEYKRGMYAIKGVMANTEYGVKRMDVMRWNLC